MYMARLARALVAGLLVASLGVSSSAAEIDTCVGDDHIACPHPLVADDVVIVPDDDMETAPVVDATPAVQIPDAVPVTHVPDVAPAVQVPDVAPVVQTPPMTTRPISPVTVVEPFANTAPQAATQETVTRGQPVPERPLPPGPPNRKP
jgi:hypothetical protein